MNLVNSFFSLMGNTEGGLCAKFQACDAKFELFTAKKKIGPFLTLFLAFLAKNSYLLFDLKAEIWLKYAPNILGLACKISGKLLKAFGRSVTKYPRGSKSAKFWDLFLSTLKYFFVFLGRCTPLKVWI